MPHATSAAGILTRATGFRVVQVLLGLMLAYGGIEDIVEIGLQGSGATPGRFGLLLGIGVADVVDSAAGRYAILTLDALVSVLVAAVGLAMLYRSQRRPGLMPGALLMAVAVVDEMVGVPAAWVGDVYFAFYWPLFATAFLLFGSRFPSKLTPVRLARALGTDRAGTLDRALLRPEIVWPLTVGSGLTSLWYDPERVPVTTGTYVTAVVVTAVLFVFLGWG